MNHKPRMCGLSWVQNGCWPCKTQLMTGTLQRDRTRVSLQLQQGFSMEMAAVSSQPHLIIRLHSMKSAAPRSTPPPACKTRGAAVEICGLPFSPVLLREHNNTIIASTCGARSSQAGCV